MALSSIFGKRSASSGSAKAGKGARGSGNSQLLADPAGSSAVLVFGAGWRTMVSSKSTKAAAKQLIKSYRPSHFVIHQHLVGYALLQGKLPDKFAGELYSAALLASKLHTGPTLYLMTLGEGQYWMALTRNGLPTATDEVFREESSAKAVLRARNFLAQFEGEFIVVYTDIETSAFEATRPFSLVDLFEVPRAKEDLFEAYKQSASLPKPVMYGMIALCGVILAQKGWDYYKRTYTVRDQGIVTVQDDPPEVAWGRAIQEFERTLVKPAALADYTMLRGELLELPVLLKGWSLYGMRCERSDIHETAKRKWACNATYKRGGFGLTSKDLQQEAKSILVDKQLTFPDLETAVVSWSKVSGLEKIKLADLPLVSDIQMDVMAHLQRAESGMSDRPSLAFIPLELTPPRRQDGTVYAPIDTVPALSQSTLTLRGSLHTMDYLASRIPGFGWKSFGVQVSLEVSPKQKDLKNSFFSVELTGDFLGLAKPLASKAQSNVQL